MPIDRRLNAGTVTSETRVVWADQAYCEYDIDPLQCRDIGNDHVLACGHLADDPVSLRMG